MTGNKLDIILISRLTFSEVASLDHKVLYNSVKRGAFEAQLFPCGFSSSLFTCKQMWINQARNKTYDPHNWLATVESAFVYTTSLIKTDEGV